MTPLYVDWGRWLRCVHLESYVKPRYIIGAVARDNGAQAVRRVFGTRVPLLSGIRVERRGDGSSVVDATLRCGWRVPNVVTFETLRLAG